MKKKLDLNESTEDIEAFMANYDKRRELAEERARLEAERKHKQYLKEPIIMDVVIGTSPQKISIAREELQKAIMASGVLDELFQSKHDNDIRNIRFS